MRLIHSILTALAVGIVSSLVMAIHTAGQPGLTGAGWYAFIMIFGNTIIPIFLGVCLFSVLKKYITAAKWPVQYIAQTLLMLIITATGVCLLTILSSVSSYGWSLGWAPGNLSRQFGASYKGYIPDALLDALLTPVIYYCVSKVISAK